MNGNVKKLTKTIGNNKVSGSMKILVYSLMISSLVAMPAFAADGDAGGINGPATSGESSPSAMDGAITLEQAQRVEEICIRAGDDSQGLSSLMQKLFMQIWWTPMETIDWRRVSNDQLNINYYFSLRNGNAGILYPFTVGSGDRTHSIVLQSDATGDIELSLRSSSGQIILSVDAALPIIAFDNSITICDSHDELGACVNKRIYLANIRVVRAANNGTAVRFINKETHQSSALTINTEEVAQCLEGQMRFLSETH